MFALLKNSFHVYLIAGGYYEISNHCSHYHSTRTSRPSGRPRGMTRDVDVLFETRETDGPDVIDISRLTLISKFGWELSNKSTLRANIPFCYTSADFKTAPLTDDSIGRF